MKKILLLIKVVLIIFVISMCMLQNEILFSQFLRDGGNSNKKKKTIENIDKKDRKQKSKLPSYIAFNIKAEKIADLRNAIKITWEVNPHYHDDFIVGRALEVIDTKEKALKSQSVKVIKARSRNVFIDTDLKAGKYYYVVLAKDKVKSREVELFKEINYTSLPIIIEESGRIKKKLRAMKVRDLGNGKILISWGKLDMTGVKYNIYRARFMLNSTDKLTAADKVGVVLDKGEFIDSTIKKDGTYYYAVTSKIKGQDEIVSLLPDKTYTTYGLRIISGGTFFGASNIKAQYLNNTIVLNWDRAAEGRSAVKGYAVYRLDKPIDSQFQLNKAKHLVTIDSGKTTYTDTNTPPGNYYYAVLTKFTDGRIDLTLKRDFNYTSSPIAVGKPYKILKITAKKVKRGVLLLWHYEGTKGDKAYRIFRSRRRYRRLKDVTDKFIIKQVNITERGMLDVKPPSGIYYYGIIPTESSENITLPIVRGKNMTKYPLRIGTNKKLDEDDTKDTTTPDTNIYSDTKKENIYGGTTGSVDTILRKTFFRSEYKLAIKALENIIRKSDNKKEKAKAKLFIGRSYVELGRYRMAVTYFVLQDVIKYYPDETKFWREYSITRIR